jgi:threonylcarbamoyladenosine tRNA methylthiotransferase MtaB
VADVYVLNTCTVTGKAGRRSGQYLRRARRTNPHAVLVAMGCHAQRGDALLADADLLVGTGGRDRIPEQVRALLAARSDPSATDAAAPPPWDVRQEPSDWTDFEEAGPVIAGEGIRAYVKIEDGCDGRCAYCAIPLARGGVRSRRPESVLAEVARAAEAGYPEVVLTGIHVCSYRGQPGDVSLLDLAERISAVSGIRRIRLGSVEPQSVDREFARRAAAISGLCPHFHVPLQSGSAEVLARMRRRYGPERYLQALEDLRAAIPGLAVTTDAIAGFPGETEEEAAQTVRLCEAAGFARMHVFRFSERAGTAAAAMAGKVPSRVADRRAAELQALSDRMALDFHASLQGQVREILVESFDRDGAACGYTPEYVFARTRDGGGRATPAVGGFVRLRVEGWDARGVWGPAVSP